MPRRTVKWTESPTAVFRIRGEDVLRAADASAVDGDDHVVGLQLPDRGLAVLDEGDTSADGPEDDLLARGTQRDGGRDLLRAVHVLQIDPAALLLADARRVDGLGRVEVGAVVQAAEEPLEQRRLPHDDVDEVDAPAGRVLAAGDGDEWRDRMGGVREEHVLAGRDDQQCERGREQHEPERKDAAGSQPALHSSDREMPPSTWTVVPVT